MISLTLPEDFVGCVISFSSRKIATTTEQTHCLEHSFGEKKKKCLPIIATEHLILCRSSSYFMYAKNYNTAKCHIYIFSDQATQLQPIHKNYPISNYVFQQSEAILTTNYHASWFQCNKKKTTESNCLRLIQ